MNIIELKRALGQLRLGGIAAVLETRLHQAQAEPMAPIDPDLLPRVGRNWAPASWHYRFAVGAAAQTSRIPRSPKDTLDTFDFNFNKKMNRSLIFDLATISLHRAARRCLLPGTTGVFTGKSHLAQAIGLQPRSNRAIACFIAETHTLLEDIADSDVQWKA